MEKIADCAAIIAAAGSGTRMGGGMPKQFLELAGAPLFIHGLRAFAAVPEILRTVVVSKAEYLEATREILARHGFADTLVVNGGETRQDSVARGLAALSALPQNFALVAVHDGARPLVNPDLIRRCLAAATAHGAAIAAVPVKDTLKREQAAAPARPLVAATVAREGLWQAQTPQVARFSLLQEALSAAAAAGFSGTDEASLLERTGCSVALVPGSAANLKVTLPEDLALAAALLAATTPAGPAHKTQPPKDQTMPAPPVAAPAFPAGPRIGHGYDVHQLTAGRDLILAGVKIDHHLGLLGHSDADVVTHALCDAILGALGAGDIGRHFPDSDPQYRGIASLKLLARVIEQAHAAGYRLANADLTIIAQRPRLAPHHQAMRANLAAGCRVAPEQINLKATTTEGLGFAGREEGIAAHAIALLTPA
ncbi:2-C-methyl-D-erythritol 4-phosphate cytidylyltransferase [Desulfurivibrio sp. C05AmB]|uniref:2-C-methyl-D-erythritol 4-phosphate cytidylyltransferase n=1 Tax=Desulfurivibrio sp. C05AmB TaxID=3374371 RepID=UPI00376F01D0